MPAFISCKASQYFIDVFKPGKNETFFLAKIITYYLCRCLDYAHSQGLYHCNLSLQSLMIDKDYNLKIIGWKNQAECLDVESQEHLCPEEFDSSFPKETSPSLIRDSWSAGVFAFWLCFGNYPYNSKALK
jgi:serine/threonine protein kinase